MAIVIKVDHALCHLRAAFISYEYDWARKPVKLTDQRGHSTTYAYDVFGRLRSETNPLNQTTSYAYDDVHGCGSCGGGGNGNLGSVTDPAGRSTHYAYDAADRLTTVTYSGSSDMVVHTYDEYGRRVATFDNRLPVADFPTQTFTWTYDKFDRMLTETYPDGEVVAWAYDVNGRRMSLTDPDENVTKYYYNDLPDNKKLAALSHPIWDNLYFYNDRGLLESDEIWTAGTYDWQLSMQPLAQKSPMVMAMADGYDQYIKTELFYDPLNRLDEQTYYYNNDPVVLPNKTALYSYNANSLRTGTSYIDDMNYGSSPAFGYQYHYDKTGRLTSEERHNASTGVEWANAFEYDLAGNRLKQFVFDGTTTHTQDYLYGDMNQCIEVYSPSMSIHLIFFHDQHGNLQTTFDHWMTIHEREHDRDNRMVYTSGFMSHVDPVTYVYDASGRLILRTDDSGQTEKYYYDGINRLLVREMPSSGCERTKEVYFLREASIGQVVARREYTYSSAPGHCEQGMQYQDVAYQYDPVGNVLIELHGNGQGVQMIDMEAFGTVKSGGLTGPRLTTKHYDSTAELYYFGARWYDPAVGQWIQKEPLGLDGPNLYHFCNNNTVNNFDSDGYQFVSPVQPIFMGIKAAGAGQQACSIFPCRQQCNQKYPPGSALTKCEDWCIARAGEPNPYLVPVAPSQPPWIFRWP